MSADLTSDDFAAIDSADVDWPATAEEMQREINRLRVVAARPSADTARGALGWLLDHLRGDDTPGDYAYAVELLGEFSVADLKRQAGELTRLRAVELRAQRIAEQSPIRDALAHGWHDAARHILGESQQGEAQ